MDSYSIEREIRVFISENFPLSNEDFSLKSEDSLIEVGVIDSTGVLELIGFIEEHYALQVLDAEVLPENLDSIENITHFVSRKLASSNGHPTG
jgi:acyl carrier protein